MMKRTHGSLWGSEQSPIEHRVQRERAQTCQSASQEGSEAEITSVWIEQFQLSLPSSVAAVYDRRFDLAIKPAVIDRRYRRLIPRDHFVQVEDHASHTCHRRKVHRG